MRHASNCPCHECFLKDAIKQLRKKIVIIEKELKSLDRAQRPTAEDMARVITV